MHEPLNGPPDWVMDCLLDLFVTVAGICVGGLIGLSIAVIFGLHT